jgi:hypothetical protein
VGTVAGWSERAAGSRWAGRFDRAYARLNLVTTIGGAASPVLLGVLLGMPHDRLGGDGPAVALLAVGSAVAGLLLFVARVDTARGWRAAPRMVPVEEPSGP